MSKIFAVLVFFIHVGPLFSSQPEAVKILFCGDLMIHKGVKRSAEAANIVNAKGLTTNYGGFYGVIRDLKRLTDSADISFCNFEAPLVKGTPEDPYCYKTKGSFFFKAPEVVAPAMKKAGFDIVSIANNHIDNAGGKGIDTTLDILEKYRILAVGGGKSWDEAHNPKILTVNGIKVAFIAYCSSLLGQNPNSSNKKKTHICRVDPRDTSVRELYSDIVYAKSVADIVVLSFHWGPKEYQYVPSDSVVKLAKKCADLGVTIVCGHHPHVLQKAEYYTAKDGRRCFIMWSLGNLVSNQSPDFVPSDVKELSKDKRLHCSEDKARRREGAAVVVSVSRGDAKLEVSSVRYAPLWTYNNFPRHRLRQEKLSIRVVSIDHEIQRLENEIRFLKERKKKIGFALTGKLEEYMRMQEGASLP